MIHILYEDNHLLILNKPPGIPTCGDETRDPSLLDLAKEWLKIQYNKPGRVFLAMVHRLDRRTQGIVVFAKTSKGASRLSEQFRSHQIKKTYLALIKGTPTPERGKIEGYLLKETLRARVFEKEGPPGSKWSSLSYSVQKTREGISLVEVIPQTGRFHQIRSLFAHRGHPLLGDIKYGGPSYPLQGGIGLQAQEITFSHPTKKEPLTIQAPYPEEWPKF